MTKYRFRCKAERDDYLNGRLTLTEIDATPTFLGISKQMAHFPPKFMTYVVIRERYSIWARKSRCTGTRCLMQMVRSFSSGRRALELCTH